MLVIQGESDPFGMPPEAEGRTLVKVKGNHSLKAGPRLGRPRGRRLARRARNA